MASDDKRENVPLSMFVGNMEVLLENTIEVDSIHFARSDDEGASVILLIGFTDGQREAARALGFKVGKNQ